MSDVPLDATSNTEQEQEQELPEQLLPVFDLLEEQNLSQQDTLDLARLLLGGLAIDHQVQLVEFEEAAAGGEACINPGEVIAWTEGLTVLNNALELLAGLNLEDPEDDDAEAEAQAARPD